MHRRDKLKSLRFTYQVMQVYWLMTKIDRKLGKKGYTAQQKNIFWLEVRQVIKECPLLSLETVAEGKLNGSF